MLEKHKKKKKKVLLEKSRLIKNDVYPKTQINIYHDNNCFKRYH